ncbi:hypothetical protein FOCC_FOCC008001 [Frankliniella occidentalis]|nr:hypothetical protein FOCC_FOCC008001 [Frankliniella occidentalis]
MIPALGALTSIEFDLARVISLCLQTEQFSESIIRNLILSCWVGSWPALSVKQQLATSSKGKYEVHWDWDRTDSAKAKDQADNVELVRGVERLINVDFYDNAPLEVLQAVAPTVEHLSVSFATTAALRETCAMPRLKRLQVIDCSSDFCDKDDADSNAVPLPPLPGGQARLQWLEVLSPRRALLELLLPAHRLTLEVLQLDSCHPSDEYKMTCSKLSAVLKLCDLRALRRLVLINMLPDMHYTYEDHLRVKDHCSRQRSVLLRVLPAGAEVLCWLCDGEEGAPLKEVF